MVVQKVQILVLEFHLFTIVYSIWLIDRTLSGATTPGQSELGSNGNEEVLYIHLNLQCLSLTIWFFSVISRTLIEAGVSYPSTEIQLVYSTTPANWASGKGFQDEMNLGTAAIS